MAADDGSVLKKEGETLEKLFDAGLKIIQPSRGYRFSIDALLLVSFFRELPDEHILEIGTGSGVISLLLARRNPTVRICGIEIQKELADMARRNAALNGMADRITIQEGDIRRMRKHFSPDSFDAALSNPPYRRLRSGKINPDRQKAIARHEVEGGFADFLHGARRLLKPSGRITFIYPAPRCAEAISRMRREKIEPKRIRVVHSYPDSEAQFILVEGIKEGGEELRILSPLFIYRTGKEYSDEMKGLFRSLGSSERENCE